jgi:hypothetical protein
MFVDTLLPRSNKSFQRFRPLGGRILTIGFGLVIATFTIFQLKALISGPTIDFESAIDTNGYNIVAHNIFELTGSVERVAYLYLNDQPQPIQTNDTFAYKLYVPTGGSRINVKIADRYGRNKEFDLLIYNPEQNRLAEAREALAREARTEWLRSR